MGVQLVNWKYEKDFNAIRAGDTREKFILFSLLQHDYVWHIENRIFVRYVRTENTLTFDAMQINGNHHST